jgi:hypothetical protein
MASDLDTGWRDERPPPPAVGTWLALASITALAVLLRGVFVGGQSLGYEEVFTAHIAEASSLGALWHGVKATESTPPLYYLLTWLWVKLGWSHGAVALRMTSLLAGSLTVPASFFAARHFVSTRLALVVAWLCAVSPVLVSYAIYARSYALLVLVSALSVWALGALLERASWQRFTLWGLAAALCLWTHYFTAFLLAAEAAVLFVRLPRERRRLLLCLAGVAAATAPLWSVFLAQNDASERTAYIATEPLSGRLEGVVRQFAMGTNVPSAWLEGAGIAVVVAAGLYALVRARREPAARVLGALALLGAGLPILSALSGIDDKLLARNLLGVWICCRAVRRIRAHAPAKRSPAPLQRDLRRHRDRRRERLALPGPDRLGGRERPHPGAGARRAGGGRAGAGAGGRLALHAPPGARERRADA